MKEKQKETQTLPDVIDYNSITLEQVPNLLKKVEAQIQQLTPKKTSVEIMEKDLGAGLGKLKDITKLSTLVYAHASVETRYKLYTEAKKKMNRSTIPKFSIEGLSKNQWLEAILDRYDEIENAKKLQRFNETKKFLEEHLSKRDSFVSGLSKLMGDLSTPLE